MQPVAAAEQIRMLESVRQQTRYWRWGTTGLATLIAVVSVATMNNAVQNLFRPGPTQDEFVSDVTAGLNRDVLPHVQTLAVQTLTSSAPLVEAELPKLNNQVPDVTNAAIKEVIAMQQDLPAQSQKILDSTYGAVMQQRETKIKAMFPDATDDKVNAFVNNMTSEGEVQLEGLNDQLFSPHIAAMQGIASDMNSIEYQEAPYLKNQMPTWQMGLLVFDIARTGTNAPSAGDIGSMISQAGNNAGGQVAQSANTIASALNGADASLPGAPSKAAVPASASQAAATKAPASSGY